MKQRFGIALTVLVVIVIGFRFDLPTTRALLIMPDLLVFQPFRPSKSLTLAPWHETVTLPGTDLQAALWLPAFASNSPAVVLSLGVYPAPTNEPNVQRLGDGLARTGLAVLIPDSERLRRGHIDPQEVDDLVRWFAYLQSRTEVDPTRVGFTGLSVGGGLSTLAAARPEIASQVQVLQVFGGYDDAFRLLASIGSWTSDGEKWTPAPVAVLAYRRQVIDTLTEDVEQEDRALLEAAYLIGDPVSIEPTHLTRNGLTVLRLLEGGDEQTIRWLLDQLPAVAKRRLTLLSPHIAAPKVVAPVLLYHDIADAAVPVDESRRLAPQFPNLVQFREYQLFTHVVPEIPNDPGLFFGEVIALTEQLTLFFRITETRTELR